MITGFNTDIKYKGVTYHVQTEDKGLDSPLILSLVYVGGAIIASKRTPYEDLVAAGFDEQALTERLQRQHKLICAAIKAGRVEDLKRMGGQNGGAAQPESAEPKDGAPPQEAAKAEGQRRKKAEAPPAVAEVAPAAAVPTAAEVATAVAEAAPASAEVARTEPSAEVARPVPPLRVARPEQQVEAPPVEVPPAAPPPKESSEAAAGAGDGVADDRGGRAAEPEIIILTTLADEIHALGDFTYRPEPEPVIQAEPAPAAPADAPPQEAEPIPVEPLLEAEILEEAHGPSDELYLSLLDDEGEFRSGQLVTVKIHVGRGAYGQKAVADASVTVKVLGTAFRPIILTATTDAYGLAVVRALLPRFNSGRAAIIIRAVAGDDSAEMRRIIHQ